MAAVKEWFLTKKCAAAMAATAEKVMAAVKEWLPAEDVSSVDKGGNSRICCDQFNVNIIIY